MAFTDQTLLGDMKLGDVLNYLEAKIDAVEAEIDSGGGGGGDSGGGVLVASLDTSTGLLDKTWQEINDADFAVVVLADEGAKGIMPVVSVTSGNGKVISYEVVVALITAQGVTTMTGSATSASDYPEFNLGD